MDDLVLARLRRFVGSHKETHGRDASHAELVAASFVTDDIDHAVRSGILAKYQVTSGKGSVENRYKLLVDWRDLKKAKSLRSR